MGKISNSKKKKKALKSLQKFWLFRIPFQKCYKSLKDMSVQRILYDYDDIMLEVDSQESIGWFGPTRN